MEFKFNQTLGSKEDVSKTDGIEKGTKEKSEIHVENTRRILNRKRKFLG